MSKYKFVGEDPVEVPSLGLADVKSGDVVEDPTDGLKGQSQWEPVSAGKKPKDD